MRLVARVVIASLVLSAPARAASRRALLDELYDVQVTRTDGSVYAIAQDDDGYLWIGGDAGASRFDGLDLVTHGPPREPAFASPQVFRLLAGAGARLWAGLAGGTFRVDRSADGRPVVAFEERSTVGPLLRFDGLAWRPIEVGDRVWALASDGGEGVWAGGERGLHHLEHGVASAAVLTDAHVLALLRTRDGALWVGTTTGLVRGRNERFAPVPLASDGAPPAVFSLLEDAGGTVWAGTSRGLARVDAGALTLVPEATDSLAYGWVEALATTPDGALWIGTRSGLVRLHGRDRQVFRRDNGLPDEQILSLHTDRTGVLWVGTRHGGFVRIGPRAVRNLGPDDGLPGRDAHAVLRARDGSMWISADDGLLRVARDGAKQLFRRGRELPDRAATALAEDARGAIWAATDNPGELLCRAPGATWNRVPLETGAHSRVRVLTFAGDELWVGQDAGGMRGAAVACTPGARVVATRGFADAAGCRGAVVDLVSAPDGAMWAAVDGAGLARISEGRTTCFGRSAGLPSASVATVLVDDVGGVWAGLSFDGGLHRLRDGRFAGLREGTGLTCDSIAKLVADRSGHLWAACATGATRVGREDAFAVTTGHSAEALPIGFGAGEGMRSPRTSTGVQPVAATDDDGALWIATDAGISVLEPPEREPAPARIVPEVTSIEIDGRVLDRGATVVATAGALRIRYTAPALWPKHRRAFRYRLDPIDRTWDITVDRRVASYPRLAPGTYTFVVQAGDGRGRFSPEQRIVHLRIVPPWHRRPTWIATAAAMLALAAWGLVRLRTRALRRRVQWVEEERARVARDLHDGLGQSLAAVALSLETATLSLGEGAAAPVRAALGRARAFLRHSRDEVKRAIWNLRARDAQQPLHTMLLATCEDLRQRAPDGARLDLTFAPDTPTASAQVNADLVSMMGEAAWNALRHARARRIELRVASDGPDHIRATIADDGTGFDFDLEQLVLRGHFGLFGLAERARLLGGRFEVSRPSTGGSIVSIVVPVQPSREELAR